MLEKRRHLKIYMGELKNKRAEVVEDIKRLRGVTGVGKK